jgi:hypothetical protein
MSSSVLAAPGPGLAKLQALGYVGASNKDARQPSPEDWTHLNSVSYNSERDQIALTSLELSEVWIIDHSTTRDEAAGHTGGKSGRGGDVLYRWGNPRTYRHGTTADQRLTGPHSANWIASGLPGEGHLLVFNNGSPGVGKFSSVEELVLPVDESGNYSRRERGAYGPVKSVWSYNGQRRPDFYSFCFSGAQRLPNGTTLICLGMQGELVEVSREGDVVWKYVLPGGVTGPIPPAPQPPNIQNSDTQPRSVQTGVPDVFPSWTMLFRAPCYAPDYPGLAGKDLTPQPGW